MSITSEMTELDMARNLSNEQLHALGRCRRCAKKGPTDCVWHCAECAADCRAAGLEAKRATAPFHKSNRWW